MTARHAHPPAGSAAALLEQRRCDLLTDFLRGAAPGFVRENTRIIDDYFIESFEASTAGPVIDIIRNPYAMIALGGYGRQEQCLHSDIDLLFLFKKRSRPPLKGSSGKLSIRCGISASTWATPPAP